ncbi:hypothetical protein P3T76_010428 [Phytophthora citrophthora]|uniref:Crinkler (CRN) family protein n=1 Tax=Phytophthora citrophthora TaxID=4793 RepID=A0AAD9GBY2_9STRA|nr:hypothetical protein P3T76_010428 [Phytophthora citrophthora]
MQLFPAKTADNKWFESDSEDVKMLKKGEKTVTVEALTTREEELWGESGLQRVLLDGMPTPSTDEIHVLVVLPSEEKTLSPITAAMTSLFQHTFLNIPSTTPSRTQKLKKQLVKEYRCDCGKKRERRVNVAVHVDEYWSTELYCDCITPVPTRSR